MKIIYLGMAAMFSYVHLMYVNCW